MAIVEQLQERAPVDELEAREVGLSGSCCCRGFLG
jgi:hypothetical protein